MFLIISMLLSSVGFAAPKKGAKTREKNITREGSAKRNDRTKIDFESTDIDGQRKLPLGSILNNTKSDKNYNFVRIRTDWHPEMIQSASSLDSGRSLK